MKNKKTVARKLEVHFRKTWHDSSEENSIQAHTFRQHERIGFTQKAVYIRLPQGGGSKVEDKCRILGTQGELTKDHNTQEGIAQNCGRFPSPSLHSFDQGPTNTETAMHDSVWEGGQCVESQGGQNGKVHEEEQTFWRDEERKTTDGHRQRTALWQVSTDRVI